MEKKYIAGFLCVLMLAFIQLSVGHASEEVIIQSNDVEPQSLVGVTFVAGLIMNPQITGNFVNAKVIVLAYYDRGIITKDSGVVMGYKNVRFRQNDLLYMSEPGQLGLVQIAGLCTGFSIQKI